MHISNSIKNLRELTDNMPDIQEECDMIERSIQYGQLLFRRLLDYLEIGEPTIEPLNTLEVLKKTESLVKPRLPSNMKLEVTIDPGIGKHLVYANVEQLMEVLIELINNASKGLSEKGGTIGIQLESRNGEVAISVKDNGPGIPQKIKKILFKKQVSSKSSLGLGLYLSNKVIHTLGGKLNLESSSEKGTIFTILLPKANGNREV